MRQGDDGVGPAHNANGDTSGALTTRAEKLRSVPQRRKQSVLEHVTGAGTGAGTGTGACAGAVDEHPSSSSLSGTQTSRRSNKRQKSCFMADEEMSAIVAEEDAATAGATNEALEQTLTAMERLESGHATARFTSGGQTSRNPLKDAPERLTSRGSHTSRGSSQMHPFGQQTARQKELTHKLSEKVTNRLAQQRAKSDEEARARTGAAVAAAATTTHFAVNMRSRSRAQQFATAHAKEEAELAEMARVGARASAMQRTASRVRRTDPVLPTATTLPPPTRSPASEEYSTAAAAEEPVALDTFQQLSHRMVEGIRRMSALIIKPDAAAVLTQPALESHAEEA